MKAYKIIIIIFVLLILFRKKSAAAPTTINYTTAKLDTLAMSDLERRIMAAEQQLQNLQQSPIA